MQQPIKVVEQSFGPELAGEQVGWVAFSDRGSAQVTVDIAVATVGEEGASLDYYQTDDRERAYSFYEQTGFLGAVALHAGIFETGFLQDAVYVSVAREQHETNHYLHMGATRDEGRQKQWANSATALLTSLKDGLTERGFGEYYPHYYYNLNALFNYRGAQPQPIQHIAAELVADPSMAETTARQIAVGVQAEELMQRIYDIDAQAQKALRPHLEVAPASFETDDFEFARLTVAELEMSLLGLRRQMYSSRLLYSPIQREWPYMDPHATPAITGYQPELQAMDQGNPRPAYVELGREMHDTERRHAHIVRGIRLLHSLNNKEKNNQ